MIDAEKMMLAILIKRGGDESIPDIKPEYFANPKNRKIFECIRQLYLDGKTIDAATVGIEAKEASYAVELSEYGDYMVGTKDEIDKFLGELRKSYTKREITSAIEKACKTMQDEDVFEAKAELENALQKIDVKSEKERPKPLKNSLFRTMGWLENQFKLHKEDMLLTTGLPSLNRLIGGLMPQNLIFLGARTSVGKTAFAMDTARHLAQKGKRTLFASLEMSDIELCTRYIAGEVKLDMQKIRTGCLESEEWTMIGKAVGSLSRLDIVVDDISRKVSEIKINAKEMKASGGLDLIIVDYLQLLQPEGRNQNREQEVASLSRDLKSLAKELDVPVIALTQLKRDAENRRPVLSDLRESGSQEQDADLVLFLWEPTEDNLRSSHQYDWVSAKQKTNEIGGRMLELVIAKQRNGPLGALYLAYFPAQTRFIELSKEG